MEQGFQNNFQKEEQGIDIKDLLYKILGFWPFVLGGALIGLAIAFTVNRYTKNVFELSTLLAVEENNNNPLGSADNIISFTWSNKDPLQGRIAILQSYTQNLAVAKELGWEVAYWNTGRLVESEVYTQAPEDFGLKDFGDKTESYLYSDASAAIGVQQPTEKGWGGSGISTPSHCCCNRRSGSVDSDWGRCLAPKTHQT